MTAIDFDGLHLDLGPGVIEPRPWTTAQARWAAELDPILPPGPMVELCAGCGPIGLSAARRTGRPVILVDASADACRWAAHNAATNGLRQLATVRQAPIVTALAAAERFPLILADPPYVPSDELGRYPADPRNAIDGGPDGLQGLRQVLAVCHAHLAPGGASLIQVRGAAQADEVGRLVRRAGTALATGGVRRFGPDRAIIHLTTRSA